MVYKAGLAEARVRGFAAKVWIVSNNFYINVLAAIDMVGALWIHYYFF